MTDQPGPETGRPPGTTMTAPPPAPRTFRRSRTDRTLAGVCGGLAESLNLDPVIVRVLMVVLTFFGGAGIIVYGACWLLMPEDDRESSLAERAIARGGRSSWPVLVLAAAIGLAVVLGAGWVIDDRGLLLIALVVIAAIVLARREPGPSTSAAGPLAEPFAAPVAAPEPWSPSEWSPAPQAPQTPQMHQAPQALGSWSPSATAPLPPLPPAVPPTPEPARPRSLLGRVTFCLVLLALGVLATVDLAGADVPAAAYPALVIAGAGLGLLVGTRYGRGRWLIALGVVGALALPPTAFADAYRGDWVDQDDRAITPVDAAGIAPEYTYRGGVVRLDLSQVDFTDQAVITRIQLGAGDLQLVVPANVDVITDIDLKVGAAEVFGTEHHGLGVSANGRDDGADGPGGGTLTVEIEQGLGHVEVRRAAA